MKKRITVLLVAILFFIIVLAVNCYADSSCKIRFEDKRVATVGETIEIPVSISTINMEGIEKNVAYVNCKIECDENAFEFVAFDDGTYMKANEGLDEYGMTILYDNETKTISTAVNGDYLSRTNKESSTAYKNLGTFRVKVKSDVVPGNYELRITNIVVSNGDEFIDVADQITTVKVNGEEENVEQETYTTDSEIEVNEQEPEAQKEANLKIEVLDKGTKVKITPDEVNGAEIGYIMLNGKKLEKEGNSYVFSSEANNVYIIYVYGKSGYCLKNFYISTDVDEEGNPTKDEENNPSDDKNSQENQSENNDKKNNEAEEVNNDSKGKNDEEKDNSTTNDVKQQEKTTKSPQTGDFIITAVGVLYMAVSLCAATYIIKIRK